MAVAVGAKEISQARTYSPRKVPSQVKVASGIDMVWNRSWPTGVRMRLAAQATGIRASAVLAVVSVALLALAVGVTWFAGTDRLLTYGLVPSRNRSAAK